MIIGIGTDITNIERFQKLLERYQDKLLLRLFTEKERLVGETLSSRRFSFYAKRFAAKEAFAKAIGTGIGKVCSWQDMEILNDASGKPFISLSSKLNFFLQQKYPSFKCHISLSDDKFALAFVVIEG